MANILDVEVRRKIIEDILCEENKRRKVDSFKRLDIYKKNQRKYILERIHKDLSAETIANMRTFTSINFTKKIIDAKASVYKHTPKRSFANASPRELEQIDALYKYAEADVKLKKGNRIYKLEDQATLQVLPKDGKVCMRVLAPHHFDVVPRVDMPEVAEVYVLSGFDKQYAYQDTQGSETLDNRSSSTTMAGYYDNLNQSIADRDDYFDKLNYFVFWSKEYHFACNKQGQILGEDNVPLLGSVAEEMLVNPIGRLPFIDLVVDRDFEYWAQTGSNITDLQLDLGAQISDTCDVNFRQGYSQAILSATEAPRSMQIGPHTLLFLKKDPRGDASTQPSFQFATPSPDLGSSIRLTEMLLAMGLTSEGLDASMISTGPSTGTSTYSSGYERLLAQIEEFSASQDDFQLFEDAESKLFDLFRVWSNTLQNVRGQLELIPDLRGGVISDNVELDISFMAPEMLQSQGEREDSAIKKLESGLISRKMAIMQVHDVDEDRALEILEEIDTEQGLRLPQDEVEEGIDAKGMDTQYN